MDTITTANESGKLVPQIAVVASTPKAISPAVIRRIIPCVLVFMRNKYKASACLCKAIVQDSFRSRTNHKTKGNRMNATIQTPWGPPNFQDNIAPGLTWFTTASHGGFHLSPERWASLVGAFPVVPWAGIGWLEEDCDAPLAIIRWPALFEPSAVFNAVRMVKGGGSRNYPDANRWLHSGDATAQLALTLAREFEESVRNQWERQGLFSCNGGWAVQMRRGQESRWFLFPVYPAQWHYTDAQLRDVAVEQETPENQEAAPGPREAKSPDPAFKP